MRIIDNTGIKWDKLNLRLDTINISICTDTFTRGGGGRYKIEDEIIGISNLIKRSVLCEY